ncbi:MAG: glutamate dehydrogenase, partial [Thermoanaerobaculia bacterium]|nr:glutamate dehydrogenase [Thermoanaerobaculia bacterium]
GIEYGGSLVRLEATGYGCVYFADEMLRHREDGTEGKICVISGSGNVAQYAASKLIEMGARVVTLSDRSGYIYDKDGITGEKLDFVIDLKTKKRESLEKYANEFGAEFHEGKRPWEVPCDMAFPCATQNEIGLDDAKAMLSNDVKVISEGANMPATADAVHLFEEAEILYAPAKAANAGGVAISGLEMSQNAIGLNWARGEIDARLREIMSKIHDQCVEYGRYNGRVNYVKGANIGGFVKVADAMLAYGVV